MKAALFLATAASAANLPRSFRFANSNGTAPTSVEGITASAPHPSGVAGPTGGSEEDPAGLTTLTVLTTSVHVVTSCAPTITDCPADETAISALPAESLSTILVTDTIVLTSTVCPVSEASSIASSVRSDADEGKVTGTTLTTDTAATATPAIPTGTEITTSQPFETIQTGAASGSPSETTDKIVGTTTATVTQTTQIAVTRTFTVTLGKGDHTSVSVGVSVTSEASEVLVTITNPATDGKPDMTTTAEGTSTTTQTTKVTATITVHRPSTTKEPASVETGSGNGSTTGGNPGKHSGSDDGQCGCNNEKETVTVTAAPETVYVTVPAHSAASTAPAASNPETTTVHASKPTNTDGETSDESADDECDADEDDTETSGAAGEVTDEAADDECDDEDDSEVTGTETAVAHPTESDVVVEVTATVVPTPVYPVNGTGQYHEGTGVMPGQAKPTGHN